MHHFFVVIRQGAPTLQNRTSDVVSPAVHPDTAVFELGLPSGHKMMPEKFRDDIANSSGVIMLTDRQTNR